MAAPNLQKNKKDTPTTSSSQKGKEKAAPFAPPKVDPAFAQAVQNYETGLRALQERKYDKAKASLEKVITSSYRELADRARVHLSTVNQHLQKTTTSFKSPEEHYDYAVSLMNNGDLEGARAHIEKIVKQSPEADYAYYGLSLLDCLAGRSEDALRNLEQAIRLNPRNRLQARNDSDFQNMADDPRFTELLYPEAGSN
jgi:tetratricopeptide (TPR) repeat protein